MTPTPGAQETEHVTPLAQGQPQQLDDWFGACNSVKKFQVQTHNSLTKEMRVEEGEPGTL